MRDSMAESAVKSTAESTPTDAHPIGAGAMLPPRLAVEPTMIPLGSYRTDNGLADQLALPLFEDLPALVWASDCLYHAITHRTGVALIGDKGLGKSVAIDHAIANFEAAEDERDRSQVRRTVFRIQSPTSRERLPLFRAIHLAITGESIETREEGRRIPDDELAQRLAATLLEVNCVALVFEEAEYLTDEALDAIRTLMSHAVAMAKDRYVGGTVRTAGVGVLFIGTPKLQHRLQRHEEHGQRWSRYQRVSKMTPEIVATTYRRLLPCFEAQAQAVGGPTWDAFIRQHIAKRAMPVRHITQHVENYVRRMATAYPTLTRLEEIPFSERLFLSCWSELARPSTDALDVPPNGLA